MLWARQAQRTASRWVGDGQRSLLGSHGAKVLRALRALEELLHKLPAWHAALRLKQDAHVTAGCCGPSAGCALHTLAALPPERCE